MNKMVKRVAHAVLKDLCDRRGFRQTWDECDQEIQDEIRAAIGRAAISAMREPSDVMAGCADDRAGSFTGMRGHDVEECKDIWRAMIDRALEE